MCIYSVANQKRRAMKREKRACDYFNWDELLTRIENNSVIPVIGHGMYEVEAGNGETVLLYDFLAEKLIESADLKMSFDSNHKFARATFEYLNKTGDSYNQLRKLLLNFFKEVSLKTGGTLWKLARIRPFRLFINNGYDDFLVNTLKNVRIHPCKSLSYALKDKKLNRLNDQLFDALENSECTLVYNIYGNLRERIALALTEKDILETIVTFLQDMERYHNNRLFQELKANSLLFIGCGYNDWLFRFFIRTMANEPYHKTLD